MARECYVTLTEATRMLGVHRDTVPSLIRKSLLKGELFGGSWLLERILAEELAKTYIPKVGLPRKRRRRRSPSAGGTE